LDEDRCNKYEYNPLTKVFNIDKINSSVDRPYSSGELGKQVGFQASD
jgi:hypothetical protein